MKNRTIELSVDNRREVIELPINPKTVEFTSTQLNQKVTLLNMGEVNMKGNRGLITTSISSFFPSAISPHFKHASGRAPEKYVEMLENWKNAKKVVRIIVTDMEINLAMLIDNFKYSIAEGDKDITYTIDLSEYRTLNVPSISMPGGIQKNGLKERPNTINNSGNSYTVVSGDSLWAIAKKNYGSGNQYQKIVSANPGITNPNLIYPGQVIMIP